MTQNDVSLRDLIEVPPQKNLADRICDQLQQLIWDGRLPEGYTFPNENVMCEQFSIGRSSLREAYKVLELQGYVTRSKRGTTVNSRQEILNASSLKDLVQHSSAADFKEFREMLESSCASTAARKATAEEFQALQKLHQQMVKAYKRGRYHEMAELDVTFHKMIISFTHNQLFIISMEAVSGIWADGIQRNYDDAIENNRQILDHTIDMHERIVNAIAAHDETAAKNAMLDHIHHIY